MRCAGPSAASAARCTHPQLDRLGRRRRPGPKGCVASIAASGPRAAAGPSAASITASINSSLSAKTLKVLPHPRYVRSAGGDAGTVLDQQWCGGFQNDRSPPFSGRKRVAACARASSGRSPWALRTCRSLALLGRLSTLTGSRRCSRDTVDQDDVVARPLVRYPNSALLPSPCDGEAASGSRTNLNIGPIDGLRRCVLDHCDVVGKPAGERIEPRRAAGRDWWSRSNLNGR
jgi:hypothetical protein